METRVETIPHGKPGLDFKMRRIRELVTAAKQDPRFRSRVVSILSGVPAYDQRGEIRRVYNFVRKHIRYTKDPAGVEFFQAPQLLLQPGAAGDCDDQVLLASAMLETIGYRTRYRVGAQLPERYAHIWLDVRGPDGWQPLELTKRTATLGFDPTPDFPIVETFGAAAPETAVARRAAPSRRPMATINRIVRRSGGRPSMLVPTALRTSVVADRPRYFGLLPSDIARLKRAYGTRSAAAAELIEAAELAGWFKRLKKQWQRSVPDTFAAAGMVFGIPPNITAGIASKFTGKSGAFQKYLSPLMSMVGGGGGIMSMLQKGGGGIMSMLPKGGGGGGFSLRDILARVEGLVSRGAGGSYLPQGYRSAGAVMDEAQAIYRQLPTAADFVPRRGLPALRLPAREMIDPRMMARYLPPGYQRLMTAPAQLKPMFRAAGYGSGFQLFGSNDTQLGYGEVKSNTAAMDFLRTQPKAGFPDWFNSPTWTNYRDKLKLDTKALDELKRAMAVPMESVFQSQGWDAKISGGIAQFRKDWGQRNQPVGRWLSYTAWTWEARPGTTKKYSPDFRGRFQALHRLLTLYWVAAWNRAVAGTQARKKGKTKKKKDAGKIDKLRPQFDKLYKAFWIGGGSLTKLTELARLAVKLEQLSNDSSYRQQVKDLHEEFKNKNEEERRKAAAKARAEAEKAAQTRAEAARRQREQEARAAAAERARLARAERDLERRRERAAAGREFIGPPRPAAGPPPPPMAKPRFGGLAIAGVAAAVGLYLAFGRRRRR